MAKTTSDIPVVSPIIVMEMIRSQLHAAEGGYKTVPIFLWGPPGVGKSSLVREIAEEEGVGFIDLRLVQLDPVDLRGLPYTVDDPEHPGKKKFGFAPPDHLPTKGRGILFLDELPQAQPLVQNAASELVLDRRIGDYLFPEGWIIVAAGNRRQDRAATQELPAHLKNRFSHCEVDPKFSDWAKWAAMTNSKGEANIEPTLLAFLTSNQGRLNSFNPDQVASPTSRTWEFVSHILRTVKDKKARNALIGGCVGKNMQAELTAYLSDSDDIPTMEQIMADPDSAPMPETPSGCAAVIDNLANTVTPAQIGQVTKYFRRHRPEDMMIGLVQILGKKDAEVKKFLEDPEFQALAKENQLI